MVSSRDASEHAFQKVQEKGTVVLFSATAPSHLPPKNEKCRKCAAPAAPCRHFPFPYQSVETVPLCTLRGQSLSYPNPLLCSALLC